jgi:hypothetical protein
MKITNISTGLKNLYQMATKRRPKAECNTTAASMGIHYTGYPTPVAYEQMPDYLMDILNSKEGWEYLNKKFPGAKYNPWNSSVCIAWAVNKAIGKEVCKVKEVIFPEIVEHVKNGGAVIIGGGFLSGGTSGHFVCIVGFKFADNTTITDVIVDDPYGNYNTHYKDHFDGNDIVIKLPDFIRLTFGRSKKKTVQLYFREKNHG